MSHINIHRNHELSQERARRAAEAVAAHLNERFELHYRWEGDALYFERSGISGRMEVGERDVRIIARLGFLLLPLKSLFENEIHRYLDELFEQT